MWVLRSSKRNEDSRSRQRRWIVDVICSQNKVSCALKTGFIAIGRAGCPFCVLVRKLLRSGLASCFFFLRAWRFVLGWARSCNVCATVFQRRRLIRQPENVSAHRLVL